MKAINKSVRDQSQEACLKGDEIVITPKFGPYRLKEVSFTVAVSDWKWCLRQPNPEWWLRELFKGKQRWRYEVWVADGGENPDRLVDSQISAARDLLERSGVDLLGKPNRNELFDADPNCRRDVISLNSGVKSSKCGGWFCY